MPAPRVTLTEPSASSAASSTVATESATLVVPALSTTVRLPAPGAARYSPLWATVQAIVRSDCGAGSAVTVKVALPPSSTAEPARRLSSGVAGVASLSRTVTAVLPLPVATV